MLLCGTLVSPVDWFDVITQKGWGRLGGGRGGCSMDYRRTLLRSRSSLSKDLISILSVFSCSALDILHIVHCVLKHAGRPSIQAGRQIDTQTYCKRQTRQAGRHTG